MQLEVKIDQDAIQAQLVAAIINGAIGEQIKKAVDTALTTNVGDYHNRKTMVEKAVQDAVQVQISQFARELVEERKEQIRAQMVEKMTDEVLDKMIDAAWAVMNGRLTSAN